MLPRNIYAQEGGRLSVTGINDLDEVKVKVEIKILSEKGEVVLSQVSSPEWEPGISTLFERKLDASGLQGTYSVRVNVHDRNGTQITANSFDFDVFQQSQIVKPTHPIAVLDLDDSLKPRLRQLGVAFSEFDESTPHSVPVFVTSVKAEGEGDKVRFRNLVNFIKAGGTAVYISGTGVQFNRSRSNQVRSETVPFSAEVEHAQGLWTCIPHLVRDHLIFEGLPADRAMREIYGNIWAPQPLRNLSGETIVAAVGFDWFSHDHKLHYLGPGKSWWGTDLGVVHVGKGKCVVSLLQLVRNLGKDPVADILFFNIVNYVST
jgi:hypothetical protein